MANLDYDRFTESVRTVLKLRNKQDDAIVKEIVQAAVRDLIEEFDSDVGSRTDWSRSIEQVTLPDGPTVSRIYLPEDALYLREAYVGTQLVQAIDMTDVEFWYQFRDFTTSLSGLYAFIGRDEAGNMYLEFATPISVTEDTLIRIDYRLYSSDITYIPEAYKNLVLYASIYHYRNWYMLDDVAAQSKAEDNYKKYLTRMRADTANQVNDQKRPYEVEWKKNFRFVMEGSINDLFNRNTL